LPPGLHASERPKSLFRQLITDMGEDNSVTVFGLRHLFRALIPGITRTELTASKPEVAAILQVNPLAEPSIGAIRTPHQLRYCHGANPTACLPPVCPIEGGATVSTGEHGAADNEAAPDRRCWPGAVRGVSCGM
jgi:hypothetical protein